MTQNYFDILHDVRPGYFKRMRIGQFKCGRVRINRVELWRDSILGIRSAIRIAKFYGVFSNG